VATVVKSCDGGTPAEGGTSSWRHQGIPRALFKTGYSKTSPGLLRLMSRTPAITCLPLSLAPKNCRAAQAVNDGGISCTKFDEMVADGRMPRPEAHRRPPSGTA
jgi:hypothetical protein